MQYNHDNYISICLFVHASSDMFAAFLHFLLGICIFLLRKGLLCSATVPVLNRTLTEASTVYLAGLPSISTVCVWLVSKNTFSGTVVGPVWVINKCNVFYVYIWYPFLSRKCVYLLLFVIWITISIYFKFKVSA